MDSDFNYHEFFPGDPMARKIVFLLMFVSFSSWGAEMKLKEGSRSANLKQMKNYWISSDCKQCEAQKIMETIKPLEIKKALEKVTDGRISPGTRVCNGLGGMAWALKDELGRTFSICEFKDKSYVLTDDLAGLIPQTNP